MAAESSQAKHGCDANVFPSLELVLVYLVLVFLTVSLVLYSTLGNTYIDVQRRCCN